MKVAVRKAIADTSQPNPIEARQAAMRRGRLEQLESLLRPTQWIDEVRAYATVDRWRLDESMAEGHPMTGESRTATVERLDAHVRELGRELAARPADIDALLPELVSNPKQAREEALGQGLGEGCSPSLRCWDLWHQMVDAFSKASPDHRHVSLLCGFLAGIATHDMPLAQEFLEDSATHPALGLHLPNLETSLPIGTQGAQRLIHVLSAGLAPIRAFSVLKIGKATAAIPPADLATLLQMLADRPLDGLAVAVGLLRMRLHNDVEFPGGPAAEILQCGRHLLDHPEMGILVSHDLTANSDDVNVIARVCLRDQASNHDSVQSFARHLAEKVAADLPRHGWRLSWLLLPALIAKQPVVALDVLLGDISIPLPHLTRGNLADDRRWPAWLDSIPAGMLMNWVSSDPASRAPRVAALCRYEQTSQSGPSTWTPLAQDLINACPDRLPVLQQFADRLLPGSWSGSRAEIAERHRALFLPYLADAEASVADWARVFDADAQRKIEQLRQQERQEEQPAHGFE